MKMKKKKFDVLVDIDGTIADTVKLTLELYNKRHGASFRERNIRNYNQKMGDTNIHIEAINTLRNPENVLKVNLYKYALRECKHLMDMHNVTFLTAREPSTEEVTREWLEMHFGADIPLIMNYRKYEIDADILIDDHMDTLKKYVTHGLQERPNPRRAILIERPWNCENRFEITKQLTEGLIIPARNWKEINVIIQRISDVGLRPMLFY